jgi:hypothetical protein
VATRSKQRGYLRGIEGIEIQSGGFMEKKRTVFGGHGVAKSSRSLSVDRAIEGGGETGEPAAEGNLCALPSADRKEKEKPIRSRFSTRMDTALNKLKKRGL